MIADCPDQKKKGGKRRKNKQGFGAWSNDEESDDDQTETANICFMAIGESSKVRDSDCPSCENLRTTIDLITDDFQKVLDEYKKLLQEKKDWKVLLEASEIEVDFLKEELEEVKFELNSLKKSTSQSYVGSAKSSGKEPAISDIPEPSRKGEMRTSRKPSGKGLRKSLSPKASRKGSSRRFHSFSSYHTAKLTYHSYKPTCFSCGKLGHKSFQCRYNTSPKTGKWIWRLKSVESNPQGPKETWVPKKN